MADKKGIKRIMVFGTFDGLHPGHLNFFKQARNLAKNPYLIVSVARDQNVKRIKKKRPETNERDRFNILKKSRLADSVVLGGLRDHIAHIKRSRPHIIALGYDQRDYVKNLKNDLKERNIHVQIARLKPYKEKIYKNHLLRAKR
jgi:FAD synthetase